MDRMADRVKRLERACLALILLVCGQFVMGANVGEKVVRASRFVVEDEKGREKAEFGMDRWGHCLLQFRGGKETDADSVTLGITERGIPHFALRMPGQGTILTVAPDFFGKVDFRVHDGDGKLLMGRPRVPGGK